MTGPSIEVNGVWKHYRRGVERINFRQMVPGPLGRRIPPAARPALEDVSFSVEPGGTLAIIGHNGAGKSTLLKLLARVTAPTRGSLRVKGRVASLIELGVGFHPDLTGRENVAFAGAVLGMSQSQVRKRYDEIVDFAGIPDYMDTPVKRYSSGMLARLGFAVAAHVDADVMVVDEVLSVGDAEFQKRSHRRLTTLREEGAAVLFVTHNLWAVEFVSPRTICLSGGKIVDDGPSREVVDRYQAGVFETIVSGERGSGARFANVRLLAGTVEAGERLVLESSAVIVGEASYLLTFVLATEDNLTLAITAAQLPEGDDKGHRSMRHEIGPVHLAPGSYRLWYSLTDFSEAPLIYDQASFPFTVTGDKPWHGHTGFVGLNVESAGTD
ncbi:MAG: Teichoic acid export ATP-binding protein TagH [Frankiales bacterium]|nr:Teichoic acid export ATP-binding protein TagH [Frankiales bacterium]